MEDLKLDKFIDKTVERAKRNLGVYRTVNGRKRRSNSTGRLRDSLEGKQTSKGVEFSGEAYGLVVEGGRRVGAKPPPVDAIIQWINDKGIRFREDSTPRGRRFANAGRRNENRAAEQRKLAFRIANSISRNGIDPTYFFSEAVEESLDLIESDLELWVLRGLSIELDKLINGNNN